MVILMVVDNCRVPKPEAVTYRYTEVVRKQELRRKMDGFACFQCQQVSPYYVHLCCHIMMATNIQVYV